MGWASRLREENAGLRREVALGGVEPGALHLFAAAIYQLLGVLSPEYHKPFVGVLAAVGAEFQRRSQQRGAPAVVRFAERLPALEIEALSNGFRAIAAGLRPSEEAAREAKGAAEIVVVRMVTAASELATEIAELALECRVAG